MTLSYTVLFGLCIGTASLELINRPQCRKRTRRTEGYLFGNSRIFFLEIATNAWVVLQPGLKVWTVSSKIFEVPEHKKTGPFLDRPLRLQIANPRQ